MIKYPHKSKKPRLESEESQEATTGTAEERRDRDSGVTPPVPLRCQRVEDARKNRDLAKKSLKIIHETLASEPSAPVESVLQLEELKDPEVQVALTRVAGNFLPLAIIQEILPSGVTSENEDFEETVGTQLILQLLGNDHHQVEELEASLETENFSRKELGKVQRLLRSVSSSEALTAPTALEVATSVSEQALQRGISVIRNIVTHQDQELNVEEVVKYFSVRQLKGFDRPDVQMAFLTVAKRISSPHHVEILVAEELHEKKRHQLPLLGFKVLVEVAQMNPYQIEKIERFLMPGDLAPTTTQQAVAWVEEISQEVQSQQSEERTPIDPFSQPIAVRPNLLIEKLASREESWERAVSMVEQLRQVDCIPEQAKLLGLACQLSSPQEVYKVLASEILTQENILPVVGSFALCKIVEDLAPSNEQIITLTEPSIELEKSQGEEEKIVWQNIASFVQLPQQNWEKVVSLPQRKEMFEKALVNTVQIINKDRVDSGTQPLLSATNIPSEMEALRSQLALLSISERLTGTSILEQPVLSESLISHTGVSRLGVRALASAIQQSGLTIASEVPSILHSEDLTEDEAKHRLRTLLCLAHSCNVKQVGALKFAIHMFCLPIFS